MADKKGNTLVIVSVIGVVAAVSITLLLMNKKAKKIDQAIIGIDAQGNNVYAQGYAITPQGITLPPGFVIGGYNGSNNYGSNSDDTASDTEQGQVHASFANWVKS